MGFALDYKSRAWIATVQIENMKLAGLTQEQYMNPETVAGFFVSLWENSGKGRTAGISVCLSEKGLFHCHMALYGNTTTLKKVADILFKSHVEPQKGGKKELKGYLLKEPPYDEKGEKVLYSLGIENLQDCQGQRSDLDEISRLIESGMTPDEIFSLNIHNFKYEKIIKNAFYLKRKLNTPFLRNVKVFWHTGESGCGKSYTSVKLAEQVGEENIYFMTDLENGGLDKYNGERILFIDEFKGNIQYSIFLNILGRYKAQIHCRYSNILALWEEIHVTSIYAPEEAYKIMTNNLMRERDSLEQLLRRIDTIIFHYKKDNQFMEYSVPTSNYTNYEQLKQQALSGGTGFVPVETTCENPFEGTKEIQKDGKNDN